MVDPLKRVYHTFWVQLFKTLYDNKRTERKNKGELQIR